VLSALIAGGWDRPQIELPPEHGDGTVPPQELPSGVFVEGAVRTIRVNAYERDRRARQACLDHFGYDCVCCGFNFERTYGPLGRGFIHVHHTVPLASIGHSYEVDPIRDLVPVCPNCHAIIHSPHPEPALSIAAMRELVALANHQTSGDVRQ
jgi:5-methylcytosine-specific restriction protein A